MKARADYLLGSLPVITLVALGALPLQAQDETRRQIDAQADLPYATVDGRELKLDLARPGDGDGPFPAIVAIHGGAWRAGNKSDLRGLIARFAEEGYVAISPQYRFCPEYRFPAQIHDVKAAVRWLRAHAEDYHIDPDRIGVVGFSAGGHLAMLLGATDPGDGLEGAGADADGDTRIQAVVNFFGPTDLAAEDIPAFSAPLRDDLIGGTPEEEPEATRAASPLSYISRGDPPMLTFQGTADPLVPPTQATALAEAMAEAGVDGRVELLIGAGHGFREPELSRTGRASVEFFDRHLKGKGEVPKFLRD